MTLLSTTTGSSPDPSAGSSRHEAGGSLMLSGVRSCRTPAALLFVDIADYTAFAERHAPDDVIRVLDGYFRAVTAPVIDRSGHVVDYYGDGLFAAFIPDDGETTGSYARRALDAAVALFDALGPFNESLAAVLGEQFAIRAGLHAGPVVHGTVGPDGARKAVLVGDAVNVASRVERAAKGLGAGLLVTDQALAAAAGPADGAASAWVPVCAVHSHEVELPGKSERFTLVEVDTGSPAAQPASSARRARPHTP